MGRSKTISYLGETEVNIKDTKFAKYDSSDWAMEWIERYGQIDGSDHKAWVLDQVARILKGCEVYVTVAKWSDGLEEYRLHLRNVSDEYHDWILKMRMGEDGENTYWYDYGIAP